GPDGQLMVFHGARVPRLVTTPHLTLPMPRVTGILRHEDRSTRGRPTEDRRPDWGSSERLFHGALAVSVLTAPSSGHAHLITQNRLPSGSASTTKSASSG